MTTTPGPDPVDLVDGDALHGSPVHSDPVHREPEVGEPEVQEPAADERPPGLDDTGDARAHAAAEALRAEHPEFAEVPVLEVDETVPPRPEEAAADADST